MWTNTTLKDEKLTIARLKDITARIHTNWGDYETIKAATGVPSYVTACFDYRESSFDHSAFLANGDPLFNSDGVPLKTSHVPKGLGPFSNWLEGAIASIKADGLDAIKHWDLVNALYVMEAWNGFGYSHRGLESPYLWSKTNWYSKGLFNYDGHFEKEMVDQQIGCVPILLALKAQGIDLNEIAPPPDYAEAGK